MITLLRHQKFLLTLSVFDEGQGTQFALNSIFAYLHKPRKRNITRNADHITVKYLTDCIKTQNAKM